MAARVLLVEDNQAARLAIAELLGDLGFEVLAAEDGAHALTICSSGRIDALVADIGLPDIGGTELAERIRALHPELCVIFASGRRRDEVHIPENLGPRTSFMQKPVEVDTIARELRRLLGELPSG
jgi:CheY-like chemotaxis protein